MLKALRSMSTRPVLERADGLMAAGLPDEALRELRRLSIEDLGALLLEVPDRFPALKAALPEMPPDRIQREWTGNSGPALLVQTCAFVRSMEAGFVRLTGRPLQDRTILDYGCGWGRILRLMCRFSAPEQIYGLDPWPAALEICRETRVLGNLARSDDVPTGLPFEGVAFDLVYAFSVFTHLSWKTALAALAAIRRRIREDGLLVLTVRPVEYWEIHPSFPAGTTALEMRERHLEQGFAFLPHCREPIDGEVTFGDASVALDHVRRHWTDWEVAGHVVNRLDPYQEILLLRPRPSSARGLIGPLPSG